MIHESSLLYPKADLDYVKADSDYEDGGGSKRGRDELYKNRSSPKTDSG